MTIQEFTQGIKLLRTCGAPVDVDDGTLKFWFEILGKYEFVDFRKAIVELVETKTTWFPNDNIPALILVAVKVFRKKRIISEHTLAEDNKKSAWIKQIEAEGRPEFNLKELTSGIGKPLPTNGKAKATS